MSKLFGAGGGVIKNLLGGGVIKKIFRVGLEGGRQIFFIADFGVLGQNLVPAPACKKKFSSRFFFLKNHYSIYLPILPLSLTPVSCDRHKMESLFWRHLDLTCRAPSVSNPTIPAFKTKMLGKLLFSIAQVFDFDMFFSHRMKPRMKPTNAIRW